MMTDRFDLLSCKSRCGKGLLTVMLFSWLTVQASAHSDHSLDDIDDRWTMTSHRQRRQTSADDALKYRWVTQCGISDVSAHDTIEIRATQHVNDSVLDKAALLLHRLVSFMSPTLFRRLAAQVSVGIYLRSVENPSAFPEYLPTDQCRVTCNGNCSLFCSERGIPVMYEVSYGGRLVVVPAENVDCSGSNPSRYESLLVAEFSAALYKYGLTGQYKKELDEAFKDAPSIWQGGIPQEKYFRQATLSWFQSTKLYKSITYGMNHCFGGALCPDERYSRSSLKKKDVKLYETLTDIYNYGRSYIHGGVTLCSW